MSVFKSADSGINKSSENNIAIMLDAEPALESMSLQEVEALSNEVRMKALEDFGQNIVKCGKSVLNMAESAELTKEEVGRTAKETALVLWSCVLGTLGSDRLIQGKLIEFDANRALIAIDKVTSLRFTWGKTILKVDVLGLGLPVSFLGIAQETTSRKSDSGLGLLVVSFSQMNEATKNLLWDHLFH